MNKKFFIAVFLVVAAAAILIIQNFSFASHNYCSRGFKCLPQGYSGPPAPVKKAPPLPKSKNLVGCIVVTKNGCLNFYEND